jgi:hypothetical protein
VRTTVVQIKYVYFEGELSRLMKEQGVTPETLADTLEKSQAFVTGVVAGRVGIDLLMATTIARCLNLPFAHVFGNRFEQ